MLNACVSPINKKQSSCIYLVLIIVVIFSTIYHLGLYQKKMITINGLTLSRPSMHHFSASRLEDADSYWNLFKGTLGMKYSFDLQDNQVVSINFENIYLNDETSLIFMKEKVYLNNSYNLKDKLIFRDCILENENNSSKIMFGVVGRHKVKNILFTITSNNKLHLINLQNQICK